MSGVFCKGSGPIQFHNSIKQIFFSWSSKKGIDMETQEIVGVEHEGFQ